MLKLFKKLENFTCKLHCKPTTALSLIAGPIETYCNMCLLDISQLENSNYITYYELQELIQNFKQCTYEGYDQISALKNNISQIVDSLIMALRDFQNYINSRLMAQCEIMEAQLFIQQCLDKPNIDEYDLTSLRCSVLKQQLNNKKDQSNLSLAQESLLSIIFMIQESKQNLQIQCDDVIQYQLQQIKQEELRIKQEPNHQTKTTKKQYISLKYHQKNHNSQIKDEKIHQQIYTHNCQFKRLFYENSFNNNLATIFKGQNKNKNANQLQQAIIDQNATMMLTRDRDTQIVSIWSYSQTTTQYFSFIQRLLIPQRRQIMFGFIASKQIIVFGGDNRVSFDLIIYNFNDQTNLFEKSDFIQFRLKSKMKNQIKPMKENKLLVLVDGCINIIEFSYKQLQIKPVNIKNCYCFAYDEQNEILYYIRKDDQKIYKLSLYQNESTVVAIGQYVKCYRNLIIVKSSKLLGISDYVIEIINIEQSYRMQIITFSTQLIYQPIIIEDYIIIQTEKGDLFIIQDDNQTMKKLFILNVAGRTRITYCQSIKGIFIFRYHEGVAFTHLELTDFNQRKAYSSMQQQIQKGPDMIMNL